MEIENNKDFMNIPKKECLVVYKGMINHSDAKWNSGEKLAEIGDYGTATSLLIFSIEELIKSLVILLDGKGFEFRNTPGVKIVFQDHRIRYVIAYLMFSMNLFGEDLICFILKVRNDKQEVFGLMKEFEKNKESLVEKFIIYLYQKIKLIDEENEWFSQVDIFRQDGLYCDYEQQFKNPLMIGEGNYLGVLERLKKVRSFGKEFITIAESDDDELIKQIKQLSRQFREDRVYQKLGNSLSGVRKSGENPFDLIKELLKDFSSMNI